MGSRLSDVVWQSLIGVSFGVVLAVTLEFCRTLRILFLTVVGHKRIAIIPRLCFLRQAWRLGWIIP